MFSCIHSPVMDNFFDRAKVDMTPGNVFHFYEVFHALVNASRFHLYDKNLYEMTRDFDKSWQTALSFGAWFKSVPVDAFRFNTDYTTDEGEKAYAAFHKTMDDLEFDFRLLCFYVRENYPELDLDETDKAAWREYVEFHAKGSDHEKS